MDNQKHDFVFDESDIAIVEYAVEDHLSIKLIRSGEYQIELRNFFTDLARKGAFTRANDGESIYKTSDNDDRIDPDDVMRCTGFQAEKNYFSCFFNLECVLELIVRELSDTAIQAHADTLLRKKKQLIIKDDYGNEDCTQWESEKKYFVERVIKPYISGKFSEAKNDLLDDLLEFTLHSKDFNFIQKTTDCLDFSLLLYESLRPKSENLSFNGQMSGHDYEKYVSGIFERCNWVSRVTKASGDQGADILAKNGSLTIVVQCKMYSSPVGNKSVQEVYSAKDLYGGTHACVVTNTSYTAAAKTAAAMLGVELLHHDQIEGYLRDLK